MKVGAYNAMQKTPPRVFLYVQCKRNGNCNTFVALRKQPSHPARLFRFLPLVYICADVRYNPINMMNRDYYCEVRELILAFRCAGLSYRQAWNAWFRENGVKIWL